MTFNHTKPKGGTADKLRGPMPHQRIGAMDRNGRRPINNGQQPITCIDAEIIVRYFFNDLSRQTVRKVKNHLASCKRCSRKLAALAIALEINRASKSIR